MEKILRALGRPIFLLDHAEQKILMINGPGEELLGAASGDVIGKSWMQYFDDASTRRIEALMEILESNNAVEGRQELQLTLKRRTGRLVTVNLTLTPFLREQKASWLFDLEDLSPILTLQREKEELVTEMSRVSKLADIGRLTGGIAHELNNPLAILQGLVENIEMSIDDNDISAESLRRDLKPMQDTLTRMIRIIQSMMSVARGEDPQMESLRISELWDRAANSFSALNEFEGITLNMNLTSDLAIPVDSIRIEQVLINLVKNALYALDSNPEGKRILTVGSFENKDEVGISIADNGPGLSAKIAENLFTPFFTTKPVGKGTGLGLFLCYNIMKAHGGSLKFESVTPHGAKFVLHFPKQKRPGMSANQPRILVVDDEDYFRQVFVRKLERWGFSVISCASGADAIMAMSSAREFDLVLTDFRMPGVDGTHLVEEIRKKSKVPVAFVTGFGPNEALGRLVQKKVIQGILAKPVADKDLRGLLKELLGPRLPEAFAQGKNAQSE